ncbi:hypothetical protein PCYB_001600 [Plasmodium cynomolgi strain B]|uniref:CYIR protein n=1 Tax=Plasmodium cynomolgi (strain B) TaxID=1120755 RepID=K6VJ42_PLACD|nr:hypothetical protein PCYB_001600 [Plasmodium cynomolgi strain B]GAB69412.1 hypothetical protein PCYB_001600 [Plasmodium cynomolgi strain B]
MSADGSDFFAFAKKLLDKNSYLGTDESYECKSSEISSGNIDEKIKAKIKRNIEYLKGIRNAKAYRITCLYYKYWMYEQIKNTINSKKHEKNDGDIIDDFVNFHKDNMKKKPSKAECEYHFIHKNLLELTYFIEQKHLHNYYVNYENIIEVSTCNKITSDKYRKYIQSISNLYMQHKKECCDEF